MVERSNEIAALNRALAALGDADERGDLLGASEWRDELDVLALHANTKGIRSRCKAAIRASEKRLQ